jgi:hypothetical protein
VRPIIHQDLLFSDFFRLRIFNFLNDGFILPTIYTLLTTNRGLSHRFLGNFLLTLLVQIDWERRRERRVFYDKLDNVGAFEIFDGIRLQDKCNLRASFQGFTPGIGVGGETVIFTGRTKNVLPRIGVFGSFGGNGSDVDLIGNQKAGMDVRITD